MRSLAAIALALPGLAFAQRQDFTLPGRVVALYNIAGVLRVEGGTGDAVRVEVTPGGRDAARLRVETGPIGGKQTLRVTYPDDRVVYRDGRSTGRRWGRSETRLRVARDGTFDGRGNAWRDGQVEVVSTGDGLEAHADMRVVVPVGKSVDFHLGVGEVSIENVEGDIRVEVATASVTTAHTKGALNLDTGSGDVRVSDAAGDVILDTGSGEVTVSRVKGRELKMDTGSGSMTATSIDVESLGLDTGSGRVALKDVKARDLMVDTGSGSVEIDLSSDVDRLAVDTGSGGITIGVPSGLGAELSIETGSGGIDADIPMTVKRSGRRSLTGSIGDGRGRISIETGSGGVRLRTSP